MFRRCRLRRAEDKLIKLQDFQQLREAIPSLGRARLDPPELQAAAAAGLRVGRWLSARASFQLSLDNMTQFSGNLPEMLVFI